MEGYADIKNVKKCLVIPKPVDKKLCFEIPLGTVVNPIKKTVDDMPKKIKKDVVDPAVKGVTNSVEKVIKEVKDLINKIKKELSDLIKNIKNEIMKVIKTLEEKLSKIGDIILKQIMAILISVFKALMVIFKPIFGIGVFIAKQMWGVISKVAPFIDYVPYLIIASFTTPIFLPFMVIALVLSIFTGPMIFLVMFGGMVTTPLLLYWWVADKIKAMLEIDFEKEVKNILEDAPELFEDLFKIITEKISDIFSKVKL